MPGPTTCHFGNTVISQGFDGTFGPGIAPSVFNLYTLPHLPNLPQVADFVFQTAGEPEFRFPDCSLEQPVLISGRGGQLWRLPIRDRRWKWQSNWAPIYGHYNVQQPDGTYLREQTPRELASFLLDALGETGYSLALMPNAPRPEVHWDGVSAAMELDQLCSDLSCVIVLNPLTNKIEIWPYGTGAALPAGDTQGTVYTPIIRTRPQRIIAEASPTLFQATFTTEAVGLDVDDKWYPINQLSYTPAGGWGSAAVSGGFPEIPEASTYTRHGRVLKRRDLAKKFVFKCYRISGLASGGWVPSGMKDPFLAPQSRKDVKFYDYLADEAISPSDNGVRPLPINVYAKWFEIGHGPKTSHVLYTEGYDFNTTEAIITFSEPLFLLDGSSQIIPAEIRVECAFNAGRDGVMDRRSIEATQGVGWTTPPRIIQRGDIFDRVWMRFSNDAAFTVENTTAQITSHLQYWLDAVESEYTPQNGGTVNYAKLMPLSLDGVTQQVTWSGGGGRTPSTTVSQAQRHDRHVEPPESLRDRYRTQLLAQADKAVIGGNRAEQLLRYGPGVT